MKLLLFTVVAFIATGEALKCYKCTDPPSAGCGTPFNRTAPGVEILVFTNGCQCSRQFTITQTVNYTVRDCLISLGDVTHPEPGHDLPKTDFCNTDLCNGASSITSPLLTFIFAVVLTFISRT